MLGDIPTQCGLSPPVLRIWVDQVLILTPRPERQLCGRRGAKLRLAVPLFEVACALKAGFDPGVKVKSLILRGSLRYSCLSFKRSVCFPGFLMGS